jgi:quercetin dioxygenase-like cupin family protein
MSQRYAVTSLDGLVQYEIPGQPRWHTIRSTLGIGAFGINAWTATEDGQQVIGAHDEASGEAHEEVYVVLSGNATFTFDGETVEAPQGTVVHVPDPTVERGAVATAGTTILVIGAKPGVVFTPSSWEQSAEALRYWPTEEWDKAVEVLEGQLERDPERAGTHYNLACAHARADRPDDALGYLTRAIELQESFAGYARTDEDLESLREDPRFPAG